jgi:hypothetical protein
MAVDLTRLTAASERITNAREAVLAFINGVPGLIRDAVAKDDVTDATNINALADKLETDATTITDAILAGTPAEETGGGTEG